jgi:hypothetical protein
MQRWFLDNQDLFADAPTHTVDFVTNNLPPDREIQAEIVRAYKKDTYVKKPRVRKKTTKLNKNAWQEIFRDI